MYLFVHVRLQKNKLLSVATIHDLPIQSESVYPLVLTLFVFVQYRFILRYKNKGVGFFLCCAFLS